MKNTLQPLSGKTYFIHTFGCQMNESDSENLAGTLSRKGATPADSFETANIVIVNTCAVRQKSVEKLYSLLGRLRSLKKKRKLFIGVVGCVAQLQRREIMNKQPAVDFILGPHNYDQLDQLLERLGEEKIVATEWRRGWGNIASPVRTNSSSAYLTIMEGCNNFCSYCIVPFTRGREKYRPMSNILSEAHGLADQGYREIQLLGQNVNSYRDPETGEGFPELIDYMDSLESVKWIRFITSHPRDLTPDIISALKRSRNACRQIHLPVQAGSNRILSLMNRGYSREDYLNTIRLLRKAMPDIALSADIIVGFPGEDEADFQATMSLLETIRYTNIFSFRYSPRPNTKASKWEDDVPLQIKRDRLIQVQSLQRNIQMELHSLLVGRTFQVLCTGRSKKDPNEFMGRNEYNHVINFPSSKDHIGNFLTIKITGFGPYSLRGEPDSSSEKSYF